MNTIKELKQREKYKTMLKRKNKEKNTYKTQNQTLRIKYEGIKKLLEKKDQEIERLNNIIETKDEGINALTEDLCETAKELEEATNTIKMALDYIQNAEGNDINYVATLLLGRPVEIEEKREQVLTVIGGKRNE